MDRLLLLGGLLVLLPALYAYTASIARARFPMLRNKRVCLLIAHPDDEAMFFAPTLLALTRADTGNHVKILCLSTGNADGLGETRKRELSKSALALGLRSEEDVFVVDSSDFPDSMTTNWDRHKISALLAEAFAPHLSASVPSTSPPNIDVLITFDSHGVSSHPNHISLYHGATTFLASLARAPPPSSPRPSKAGFKASEAVRTVDLYTLTTVSLWRKYAAVLDLFTTVVTALFANPSLATAAPDVSEVPRPRTLVFNNPLWGEGSVATAWGAMTTAHKSQMVWFRWGWILFSRYMVVNDLRLEQVP